MPAGEVIVTLLSFRGQEPVTSTLETFFVFDAILKFHPVSHLVDILSLSLSRRISPSRFIPPTPGFSPTPSFSTPRPSSPQ